jgi:hypothetical protein
MNKTKIISFTYTKDKGEVTERLGITLGYSSPELGLMADVTGCDTDKINELITELSAAKRMYLDDVECLLKDRGVQQKTFKLANMTNKKEIKGK